jgi:hypothetical protein
MVKEKKYKDKIYYMCEACDMNYENKDIAEKCEKHCNEKRACNTELIKHAIELREDGG